MNEQLEDGFRCEGTYEFALEAGVGKPFDANAVTDLYRGLLGVFANSDDLTDTFVTTDKGTYGKLVCGNRRQ